MQHAVDLLENDHVVERGLAEKNLAGEDVGFGEMSALGRNLNIAFLQRGEAEQHRSLDDREQVLGVHFQDFGETMKIFLAAAVLQQFEQAGDASDARVRDHLIFLASRLLRGGCGVGHRHRELGLGHDLVDVVDQFDKTRRFAITGMG